MFVFFDFKRFAYLSSTITNDVTLSLQVLLIKDPGHPKGISQSLATNELLLHVEQKG